MLTYKFSARDPATGKLITSEVQAESEKAAAKAIKDQGYAPLEISPEKAEPSERTFVTGSRPKIRSSSPARCPL